MWHCEQWAVDTDMKNRIKVPFSKCRFFSSFLRITLYLVIMFSSTWRQQAPIYQFGHSFFFSFCHFLAISCSLWGSNLLIIKSIIYLLNFVAAVRYCYEDETTWIKSVCVYVIRSLPLIRMYMHMMYGLSGSIYPNCMGTIIIFFCRLLLVTLYEYSNVNDFFLFIRLRQRRKWLECLLLFCWPYSRIRYAILTFLLHSHTYHVQYTWVDDVHRTSFQSTHTHRVGFRMKTIEKSWIYR